MGRTRRIDRDKVLDAAERIVAEEGPSSLTIDAVAKAMGITKGGVQYCFGSKDALVSALLTRWSAEYDADVAGRAGPDADIHTRLWAHVAATAAMDEWASRKAAGLMAAMMQSPAHMADTRAWYNSRLEGLDTATPKGRRARLAFVATEGAFLLRHLGLMDMDDGLWAELFADIGKLRQE